jgi:hypothetical protein
VEKDLWELQVDAASASGPGCPFPVKLVSFSLVDALSRFASPRILAQRAIGSEGSS